MQLNSIFYYFKLLHLKYLSRAVTGDLLLLYCIPLFQAINCVVHFSKVDYYSLEIAVDKKIVADGSPVLLFV